jgi:hypothetical protein
MWEQQAPRIYDRTPDIPEGQYESHDEVIDSP